MTRAALALLLAVPLATPLALAPLLLPAAALAQDDGDLLDDDEDDDDDEGDTDDGDDDEDLLGDDDDEPPDDLLGDEEDDLRAEDAEDLDEEDSEDLLGETVKDDEILQEGMDNAKIYQEALRKFSELVADEEMIQWERYLEVYPKSVYRDRIERRLDDLEGILYRQRIDDDGPGRVQNNDDNEIWLSQGLTLDPINPITRSRVGLDVGLPGYFGFALNHEQALTREFSVHGGIGLRYAGPAAIVGTRYALIKSARTQTLVTAMADLYFNFDPAFVGFRPQIGFGQRFGDFDVQLQVGTDIELRTEAQFRLIGGLNVSYRINDSVGVFLEGNMNMKWLELRTIAGEPQIGNFRFNVASFGLKFYPEIGVPDGFPPRPLEIQVGGVIPFANNYWGFHQGAVTVQANFYYGSFLKNLGR